MDVAAAGGVVLVNAPGNGVADDKAMYRSVPELIGYYLDERPLLGACPTYRLSDEAERRAVLERVGELVTKPVDGYGGRGVLIGPTRRAAEVAARRPEIAAEPADWVAQEVVPLSSVPAGEEALLQPRHVDLRAFVYATGHGRGGLPARRPRAHPGRARGQPRRELLAGRRGEGHLDRAARAPAGADARDR